MGVVCRLSQPQAAIISVAMLYRYNVFAPIPKLHNMIKPGQTLHMGGLYGPSEVQGVLYLTNFHSDGHEWWVLARGSQGHHSIRTGHVGVN